MARLRGTFSCFQMFFLSEAPGIDQHGNNEQYHTLKSRVTNVSTATMGNIDQANQLCYFISLVIFHENGIGTTFSFYLIF